MTLLIDLWRSSQETNRIEQTSNVITPLTPQVHDKPTPLQPMSYTTYKLQTSLEAVFDSYPPLDKGGPHLVREMSSLKIQWRKYRLFARVSRKDASVRDELAF